MSTPGKEKKKTCFDFMHIKIIACEGNHIIQGPEKVM